MKKFIIEKNECLSKNVAAYYHTDYIGAGKKGNPDYLYSLKNVLKDIPQSKINESMCTLRDVLLNDFPKLNHELNMLFPNEKIVLCMIPRSKTEKTFTEKQLRFKYTVNYVANETSYFINGVEYIKRIVNTRTTHRRYEVQSFNNDGLSPYRGITLDTCEISQCVKGKTILLVDDIYTKTINIVEDAIQALYTKGAKNVVFYAVGKTFYRGYN